MNIGNRQITAFKFINDNINVICRHSTIYFLGIDIKFLAKRMSINGIIATLPNGHMRNATCDPISCFSK